MSSAAVRNPPTSEGLAVGGEAEMEETSAQSSNAGNATLPDADKEMERLSRKFSQASVCSADTNNDDDDDEANVEDEEHKGVVLLGPRVPLKEQLELDKDDESLRRWKEQLLGSVDLSSVGDTAEPEVMILSLTIVTPDRADIVLPFPLATNSKGYAFTLKDGSRYRLRLSFAVSNNIVSGLKYANTVWKTGVRVDSTKVMLGTFSPRPEPYTYELEEETTPSGIFARGSYTARTKFVDDDGKCYLDVSYYFEIRKDWPPASS